MPAVDDALMRQHLPMVKRLALRFGLKRGPVTTDDLIQEGCIGLMQAAKSFDPEHGVKFGAYAARRVLGRMQDCLREADHLSRKHRREMVAGKATAVNIRSLTVEHDGNTLDLADTLGEHDRTFADVDRKEVVEELLAGMGERERTILAGYFMDGLTMREVGDRLGLGEARISQLMPDALERLQERYRHRYGDEAMGTELCRWVKKDGSAFVLFADGRLLKRSGFAGSHREVATGMSFENAKRHVGQFDGYVQRGGPAGSKRLAVPRAVKNRGEPPPDGLAPNTGMLPATELAKRLTRLDEHQQRVRNEMQRIGQLPPGFDEKPQPEPYLGRLKEPVVASETGTIPGFPWLDAKPKEQPVSEQNGQIRLTQVVKELGKDCTYEQFCEAIKPRTASRAQFGTAHWRVFKNPRRGKDEDEADEALPLAVEDDDDDEEEDETQPSEPVAEPAPVANVAPPVRPRRPAPLLTPDVADVPSVRAVVERAIRAVGIAVLRQTLDEIEAANGR